MTNVDYSLRTYFQDKIKDKEPSLFLTSKTPGKTKVDSYSRACQSAQKRQPVILTRPEYEKIGAKYPEFLDEARHAVYGTGPEKYYYICPQYWDTRTNMPLSEKDMKDNNLYQHIIDDTQKKLTADRYIYHLNDKGKLNMYPNFIIKNGQCAPCCFNKHNTPKVKHQKKTCNQSFDPPSNPRSKSSVVHKVTTPNKTMKLKKARDDTNTFQPITPPPVHTDTTAIIIKNIKKDIKNTKELIKGSDYIKNPDKFPLDPNRLGFLPKSLTNLFEVDISRCMYIQDHKGVASDYDCILRSGIVLNRNQSFLECVADMYGISIDALKFRIYEYLTIDNFIKVQNGNLVNAFYNTDIDTSAFLTEYDRARETSKLYSVLILDDAYSDQVMSYNHIYFDKVFVSYVNFIHNYLFKTTTYVDHTFLWDIILQLYDINLCIFEIKPVTPGQDGEEIVNMLCPPNRYSMQVLHPNLKHDIAFIIKKNEYYEPVYIFRTFNKETKKIKFFNDKQTSVIYTVQLLKKLVQNIGRNCAVQETTNISVYELYRALSYKQYVVTHKVMDYSTKIIGLRVSDRLQNIAVIPCLPNTIIESDYNISTIPIKLVTSDTVWSTFTETVRFYNTLVTAFGNSSFVEKLPKLQYSLLDESGKFVVGFITQHHQLIEVTDRLPYDILQTRYPRYPGKFMTYVEEQAVSLTTVTNVFTKDLISDITHTDTTRTRISSEILLETIQYALFRNIIKTWIRKSSVFRPWVFNLVAEGASHIKNGTLTKQIKDELMNNMITVLEALSHDEAAGNNIIFIDDVPTGFIDTLTSFDIHTASTVYLSKQYTNDVNYFIKIAEEILFNNRMRKYILSEMHISFYKQSFDVNSEEILLNELSINEYYDKIDYHPLSKYTKYTYYDEVGQSGEDENKIKDEYNHIISNDVIDILCETPSYVTVQSTSFVKRIMETSIQPNIMQHAFSCIYSIIEIIMSDMISYIPEFSGFVKKTSGEIRSDLTKLYSTYDTNINITASIYRILSNEGKLNIIKYLKSINELTISNLVNTPTYTLSLLDYWILCIGYDIPAVVINERLSMASRFNQADRFVWICNRKKYTTIPERFFCILGTGSIEVGEKKIYTLLSKSTDDIDRLFNITNFLPKMQDTLKDTFTKSMDVSEYINKFVITPIKIHSK